MITVTCYPKGDWKETLIYYMSRAFTGPIAYQRVAEEFGLSEGYIKKAAQNWVWCRRHVLPGSPFPRKKNKRLFVHALYIRVKVHHRLLMHLSILRVFFAHKDDEHSFSRHFCSFFLERRASEICLKSRKLSSLTRCSIVMLQKTKEFIERFEKKMAKYGLSETNTVVFYESVIGDEANLPKVITECGKSGGGNGNVMISRMRALGSVIPFSMGDGNTPFHVFIVNEKTCRALMIPEDPLLPTAEKGLRDTPYRLFLSSET